MTFPLMGIGFFFWFLAMMQASFDYRKRTMHAHAKDIANEIHKTKLK